MGLADVSYLKDMLDQCTYLPKGNGSNNEGPIVVMNEKNVRLIESIKNNRNSAFKSCKTITRSKNGPGMQPDQSKKVLGVNQKSPKASSFALEGEKVQHSRILKMKKRSFSPPVPTALTPASNSMTADNKCNNLGIGKGEKNQPRSLSAPHLNLDITHEHVSRNSPFRPTLLQTLSAVYEKVSTDRRSTQLITGLTSQFSELDTEIIKKGDMMSEVFDVEFPLDDERNFPKEHMIQSTEWMPIPTMANVNGEESWNRDGFGNVDIVNLEREAWRIRTAVLREIDEEVSREVQREIEREIHRQLLEEEKEINGHCGRTRIQDDEQFYVKANNGSKNKSHSPVDTKPGEVNKLIKVGTRLDRHPRIEPPRASKSANINDTSLLSPIVVMPNYNPIAIPPPYITNFNS